MILFLQFGQKDDFTTTPRLFGSRYIQTLAKLPQIAPSIINNINMTSDNKNDLSLIKLKNGRIPVEIDNEIPEYYKINPGGAEHQGIFILCKGMSFRQFFHDKIRISTILADIITKLADEVAKASRSFSGMARQKTEYYTQKYERMNAINESDDPDSLNDNLNDIYKEYATKSFDDITAEKTKQIKDLKKKGLKKN